MKEEVMSQDEEEDIPVTEREMNLKVTISAFRHQRHSLVLTFL